MFGKRKPPGSKDTTGPATPENRPGLAAETPSSKPFGRPETPAAMGRGGAASDLPRRPMDPVSPAARRVEPRSPVGGGDGEGKKLVVGRDIFLSGQIKTCEKLVVEGQVEANLTDCLHLEINETGLFKGAAIVDKAEISGCFEGDLTARDRLYVRATGRISGTIRYAELEIERGGKIAGAIDLIDGSGPAEEAAEEVPPDPVESTREARPTREADDTGETAADERSARTAAQSEFKMG